jgi:hypothetical protein
MQKFIERQNGVFVSEKIVFSEDAKTVRKVMGDNELEIAPEWPLTLFRFMPFSRLYTELEQKCMTFLSPKLWRDPFENAFLELGNEIDLKCLCLTYNGSIGEEWAWKAYTGDEQLIRIEVDFLKLVETLSNIASQNNLKTHFYICVCDYSKDKKKLLSDITAIKKSGKTINLEDFLNIMSFKRKAFAGEKEIRIFALDSSSNKDDTVSFKGVDYRTFTTRVLLEPLDPYQDAFRKANYAKLQDIHNAGIKTYLQDLNIKTIQSHLYETK